MRFNEMLKKLRKEKGLTQKKLANKIYVSRTLITKYETGVVFPTRDNLEKLAEFFGIKAQELALS